MIDTVTNKPKEPAYALIKEAMQWFQEIAEEGNTKEMHSAAKSREIRVSPPDLFNAVQQNAQRQDSTAPGSSKPAIKGPSKPSLLTNPKLKS